MLSRSISPIGPEEAARLSSSFPDELLQPLGAIHGCFGGSCVAAAYQQAILIEPDEDLSAAVDFLQKAIDLAPDSRNSYANLFMLYDKSGDREQAIQYLEKYLKLFPQDSAVASELELYRAGGEFNVEKVFGARQWLAVATSIFT